MGVWPSTRARKVLRALYKIGWQDDTQKGSHLKLKRDGFPSYTWAFGDDDEIGPKMMARIAKHTGLRPDDL